MYPCAERIDFGICRLLGQRGTNDFHRRNDCGHDRRHDRFDFCLRRRRNGRQEICRQVRKIFLHKKISRRPRAEMVRQIRNTRRVFQPHASRRQNVHIFAGRVRPRELQTIFILHVRRLVALDCSYNLGGIDARRQLGISFGTRSQIQRGVRRRERRDNRLALLQTKEIKKDPLHKTERVFLFACEIYSTTSEVDS